MDDAGERRALVLLDEAPIADVLGAWGAMEPSPGPVTVAQASAVSGTNAQSGSVAAPARTVATPRRPPVRREATLPQFATFAVEDGAGQGMATFSPVQTGSAWRDVWPHRRGTSTCGLSCRSVRTPRTPAQGSGGHHHARGSDDDADGRRVRRVRARDAQGTDQGGPRRRAQGRPDRRPAAEAQAPPATGNCDARQAGEEDRRRRGAPVRRPPGNGVAATPADLDRVFYRTFGSIAPQAPTSASAGLREERIKGRSGPTYDTIGPPARDCAVLASFVASARTLAWSSLRMLRFPCPPLPPRHDAPYLPAARRPAALNVPA